MTRRIVRTLALLRAGSGVLGAVPSTAAAADRPDVTPHVVGGVDATIADAPWQVGILDSAVADPFFAQFCGGSIVAAQWIVTAAHCVDAPGGGTRPPGSVDVLSGTADLVAGSGTRTSVIAIAIHPGWDPATFDHDVAVLQLAAPLTLDGSMRAAIALPTAQDPAAWPDAATAARITGWGSLSSGGDYPSTLQKATVQVLTSPLSETCGSYPGTYHAGVMLCAGVPDASIDTCQGDSGGPLAVDVDGTWTLAGVTSWGTGCAVPGFPGVYARVPALAAWITAQIGGDGVPSPPRSVAATAGDGSATVSWLAPLGDGGSPVTGYTATATGGPVPVVCSTQVGVDPDPLSCTITGLTNGTTYSVTVTAANATGASLPASPAASVTPAPPPPPPATVPGAPRDVTAVAGRRSATVSWAAPLSDGGAPVIGYEVTIVGEGSGCTTDGALSCTAMLLPGVDYTFTVTATNEVGTGPPSAPSDPVMPLDDVPGPPTDVVATAGDNTAAVSWTAPADDGGSPITGYDVVASPGGQICDTVVGTSCVLTGLDNGVTYTITVTAWNANGPGTPSAPSNPVTPTPATPTVGTLAGTVQTAGGDDVAGALVQVCPQPGSPAGCSQDSTVIGGTFEFLDLPAGTYDVRVVPPGLFLRPAHRSVAVTAGQTTAELFVLEAVATPPPATTVGGGWSAGGVPVVFWTSPATLTHHGCEGGIGQYTVTSDLDVIETGPLVEGPSGTYTATLGPFAPRHGLAQVAVSVQCPFDPDEQVGFDVYIDPSGVVVDRTGAPVADATVTLTRSDTPEGPFVAVPDGSTLMSPANRTNPMRTGSDGLFGWDVVAGYYRVVATVGGCQGQTEVMAVPPPRTGLVITLSCWPASGGPAPAPAPPPPAVPPAAEPPPATSAGRPGAPTRVRATVRRSRMTVTWAPPAGIAPAGYQVQVAPRAPRRWATVAQPGAGATRAVWRKARPGVTYLVRVAARSAAGAGPWTAPVRVTRR